MSIDRGTFMSPGHRRGHGVISRYYDEVLKECHNFFVYGTLKKRYGNNYLFGSSSFFIGTDYTVPKYNMCANGMPAIVPSWMYEEEGSFLKPVIGEVYHVTNSNVVHRLDLLEGYPYMYDRSVIDLKSGFKAWVYYIPERLSPNLSEGKAWEWPA